MKNKKIIFSITGFIATLFMITAFTQSNSQRISLSMDTKFYAKGQVIHSQAKVYYNYSLGKMLTHYTNPAEYFMLTNNKGEAQIYYPAKNEVLLSRMLNFNTEKTILYYFLSNKIYDLGLKDLGFTLLDTRFEEGHMISEWKPKENTSTYIGKVELVHKNYLPIYIGYYNAKSELMQKIFYYQYTTVKNLNFPQKVVEITYLADGDSTVNRTVYSGISFDSAPGDEQYFNFSVPKDAKIVEYENK